VACIEIVAGVIILEHALLAAVTQVGRGGDEPVVQVTEMQVVYLLTHTLTHAQMCFVAHTHTRTHKHPRSHTHTLDTCAHTHTHTHKRGSGRILGDASVTIAQWRRARDMTKLDSAQVRGLIPAETPLTQINMDLNT